jgi:hypothetical protein
MLRGGMVKEVERDSWASFKTRRSMARVKQLLASWQRVWRLERQRRRDVEGRGEAIGGRASGVHERWRARGAERSGAGQLGLEKWPAKAAGSWARAEQGKGLEVDDRDLSAIFIKMQGLHCKAKLTFKP